MREQIARARQAQQERQQKHDVQLELPRPVECYDCGAPAKFRVVQVNSNPAFVFNQVFCPNCVNEQGGGEITLL